MRGLTIAGLALFAVFAGSRDAGAYVNYPWCAQGETRGIDCVFSSREQCAADGRGRGFGGQCVPNPFYKPGVGPVVEAGAPVKQPDRPRKRLHAR